MIAGYDSETCLFGKYDMAPALVCSSVHFPSNEPFLVRWQDTPEYVESLLGQVQLVGHHIAYDMAVLAAAEPMLLERIFAAYEADAIADTMVRQKLIDNAYGLLRGWRRVDGKNEKIVYDLGTTLDRLTGYQLNKGEDTWRKRYGELRPHPIEQWPADAVTYAKLDAWAPIACWEKQEPLNANLVDQYRQVRAAFWLQLMGVWGIHTDARAVAKLADSTKAERDAVARDLVRIGVLRPDRELKTGKNKGQIKAGSRDTKLVRQRVVTAYAAKGQPFPLTDKGQAILAQGGQPTWEHACADEESCDESGDDVLLAYSKLTKLGKRLSTDIPALWGGVSAPIHASYEELQANGRTGCHGPNIQNQLKEGGFRECFIPRPGYVFAVVDYGQIELCTFGQVCIKLIGYSKLAQAINNGIDPHLSIAAVMANIPYEEALRLKKADDPRIAHFRQSAKPINFGYPGGLGAKRMVEMAWTDYSIRMTEEEAKAFKQMWLRQWPEAREYLALIGRMSESGSMQIEQLFSGRKRGGLGYCDGANTFFSGLAADLAKDAGWTIAKACYVDTRSVLWGSRTVIFAHDEFVLEVPEHKGHECAHELSRLAVAAADRWLPDVHAKAEPLLARCWSKKAKEVKDSNGRLVPWDPSMQKAA